MDVIDEQASCRIRHADWHTVAPFCRNENPDRMRPPKKKALELIRKSLDRVQELTRLRYGDPAFDKWQRDTRVVLINVFGEDSRQQNDFDNISYSAPLAWVMDDSKGEIRRAYNHGLRVAEAILGSMVDEVEEFWKEETDSVPSTYASVEAATSTNKIFIVHGRDDGTRSLVSEFLTKLGLEPIVLQEQPNQGRTIIEKFEDYSDVAFAVVLCTPDDLGSLEEHQNDLKYRARQNVIFELGFFVGRLGRSRVSLMVKGDIEIPSDFAGVLYTELDGTGGWKMKLVGELKSAGFSVDANLIFAVSEQ